MKKLFFIFTLVLAFSVSANAQAKKAAVATTASPRETPVEAAKKDANELTTLLSLNDTRKQDFFNLFQMKYETLANTELSAERKAELKNIMEMKIRASIDEKETKILENNPALFKRLIE